MDELKTKIKGCFERLQKLDLPPTVTNLEGMLQSLYDLREVYAKLERMEADDRVEADPGGRDED